MIAASQSVKKPSICPVSAVLRWSQPRIGAVWRELDGRTKCHHLGFWAVTEDTVGTAVMEDTVVTVDMAVTEGMAATGATGALLGRVLTQADRHP